MDLISFYKSLDSIDFFLLTSITINLIISSLLLTKALKNRSNLSFWIINICFVVWTFSNFQIDRSTSEDVAIFWTKISALAIITFIVSFCFFSIFFYKILFQRSYFLGILNIIPAGFFAFFSLSGNSVISSANIQTFPVEISYGPYYLPMIVWGLIIVAFSFTLLLLKSKRIKENVFRIQLKFLSIGFGVSLLIIVSTNVILPLLGVKNFTRIGPASTIIFTTLTSYIVIKYKLFNTRIIVGRLIYFVLVSALLITFYYTILVIDLVLFGESLSLEGLVFGFPFSLIFISLYDKVKDSIASRIDIQVINSGRDMDKILSMFNDKLNSLINFEEIIETTHASIRQTLDIKYTDFIDFTLKDEFTSSINPLKHELNDVLEKSNNYPLILDEIDAGIPNALAFSSTIKELCIKLDNEGYRAAFGVRNVSNYQGVLLIGGKQSGEIFTQPEVKFIQSITNILGSALTKASLYEEVESFNKTLQQKIDNATTELTSKNQQLEEALRKERDMLDILGHELRTPLSTSRNSLNIIDIYKKQGKLDETNLNHHLDIAKENLTREIKILETILSSSRIDNSRLQLNNEEVEANDVIEDSVLSYNEQAEKKGLEIKTVLPTDKIYCYGDRSATQQIIDNLVSNAIKYTQKGSVTLETKLEGDNVVFAVSDTGEGIPAEEIPNLGKKFYRINPYLESEGKIGDRQIVRPGGTGIGLYVVFKLATMMNGTVNVTSEVGKGSTFTIKLPRFNPQIHEIKKVVEEQQPAKAEALIV